MLSHRKEQRMKKILTLCVMFVLIASSAYAAVAVTDAGTYEGEASVVDFANLGVSFDGNKATVRANPTEVVTAATKSVTAAENGEMYITTYASGTTTVTLPAAAVGLEYTFVSGKGLTVTIDTASASDTINYLTLDAGDTIDSNAATGDSVRLTCARANTWDVTAMGSSAWTDGGAT